MRTKKFIKHNLPVDNYQIVDTYSLGEDDYLVCDNCGKVIKNIAVVQNSKGKRYCVGMDCAETLSGITEVDIDFWNSDFVRAKSIRAKVRKYTKQGGIVRVQNLMNTNRIFVDIMKIENPTCLGDYYTYEEVGEEFLKKFLPELAKIAKVNYDYKPINEKSFKLNDDDTYGGYSFKYRIMQDDEYGCKYAYAEIYGNGVRENGVLLATGENAGRDIESCIVECARLYNRVEFNKGLKPLI